MGSIIYLIIGFFAILMGIAMFFFPKEIQNYEANLWGAYDIKEIYGKKIGLWLVKLTKIFGAFCMVVGFFLILVGFFT